MRCTFRARAGSSGDFGYLWDVFAPDEVPRSLAGPGRSPRRANVRRRALANHGANSAGDTSRYPGGTQAAR